MNDYSVEVKNVWKKYKLYAKPVDRLKEAIHPFRRTYHSDFEALANINLTIKPGETFALVGRNGAGKSTLLKILNSIVMPTVGSVIIRGKVVALLELGAGFNPEMTGRENIFLFGALHGYSKEEMELRCESVIAFAEVGEFIDQPVKLYSSGMFVRLAFACSIDLAPDVLIVDEALSVGDIRFQRKCFKKIEQLKANGTTIVLVSHDITLVKMFADRACLMDRGRILMIGEPNEIAVKYFDLAFSNEKKSSGQLNTGTATLLSQSGHGEFLLGNATFGEGSGQITKIDIKTNAEFPLIGGGEEVVFTIFAEWNVEKIKSICEKDAFEQNIILGISISDKFGNYILGMTSIDKNVKISIGLAQVNLKFVITLPFLKSDDYLINASMALGTQDYHTQVAWYEGFCAMNCRSSLKNIYGLLHKEYIAEII
jgi:ABC-type polysaccharide/polyol phosphate transport system ATPase subunit